MKIKLLALGLLLGLTTGCSNVKEFYSDKHVNQITELSQHMEKNHMSKQFCEGQGFRWYHEGDYFYSFTCKDGSTYQLRKDKE